MKLKLAILLYILLPLQLLAQGTCAARSAVEVIPGDNVLRFYRLAIPVTKSAYDRNFSGDYKRVLEFWSECEEYVNNVFVPVGFCFDVIEDERLVLHERGLIDEDVFNAPSLGTELLNELIPSAAYDIGMWVTNRPTDSENTGLSVQYGAYSHSTKGNGYAMPDSWVVAHEIGHLLGATHTTAGEGSLMEQGGDYLSYPSIKMIREGSMSRNSAYYSDEARTQLVGCNEGGNYVYGAKVNNIAPQFDAQQMKDVYKIPQGACLYVPVYATDADGDKLNYAALGCGKDNVLELTENDFLDIGFVAPQESNVINYAPVYSADIYYDDFYYTATGTDIPNLYPGSYVVSILVNDVPKNGDYSYEMMKQNPFYSNYAVWEATVQIVGGTAFNASLTPQKNTYSARETVTVTWGVNSNYFTKDSRVRITMSTNYGRSFDYVLAESVSATDGSCAVVLPNVNVGAVDVDFVTAVRSMRGGIIKVEEIDGVAYTLTTLSPENGGGFNITGATGIYEVKGEPTVDASQSGNRNGENGEGNAVYDLLGREVYNPSGGVYIVNGKKFIVR